LIAWIHKEALASVGNNEGIRQLNLVFVQS
jgi:hypothetical protein